MIALIAMAVLPYGWLEYCAKDPAAHCEVNQITVADLAALNVTVNHAISGRSDRQGFDIWTAFPEDRAGDCDDYVVTKRRALIALGFSPDAMSIVAGDTPEGNAHLVLYVRLDGSTWVLDNRVDDLYQTGGGPGLSVRGIQDGRNALWNLPEAPPLMVAPIKPEGTTNGQH